jgi:phosphoglycolate phosphatase
MLKAVIFDMDGVLVDSHSAWFSMFNSALEHFENKTISKEEFDKNVWAKNFKVTAKAYFHAEKMDIFDYFDSIKETFISESKLFEDTASTLENLKSGHLKLIVATNTRYKLAKELLDLLDISKYFELILGGDMVENGKPEPDILLKALQDMKLKKDEVIFIGDTIWDKIAAEKAAVRFIGLKLEGNERIERLNELIKKI